jgi:MFS family permease
VVLVILGPVSGRMTDKIGPRPLMMLGTLIVAISIYIESRITVHSGYLRLLPGFVVMGIGMGLVMSPMTTAAMNAVDRTKAGAASGVLSMSRMVGSTFGVAVMGAIVTTVGRSKLDQSLPNLPGAQRNTIVSALGSGAAPHGHASPQIFAAVEQAFVAALRSGFLIGAAVTLVSSIAAWVLIERKVADHAPAAATPPASANDQAVTPERTYSR